MTPNRAQIDLGDGTVVPHGTLHSFTDFHSIQRAVVPLVVVVNGELSGLGTAVCIGPGWFLTAAHILEGFDLDACDVRIVLETDTQVGETPDDVYGGAFAVRAIHRHPEADLATLSVQLPASALAEIRTLNLRLRLPLVGEPVVIAGYPLMAQGQVVSFDPHPSVDWERELSIGAGVVLDQQLLRLPRAFRSSPGFATDAPAPPGASGGPVLDSDNYVVGFVSSSIAPTADYGDWNSFVALLGPALELSVIDLSSDPAVDVDAAPSLRLADLVIDGVIEIEADDSFDVDPVDGKVTYGLSLDGPPEPTDLSSP